jgi:PAS domain S-box-containing protein
VATGTQRQYAEFPAPRVHDLLDVLPVGAFVIDQKQTIEAVNPAAAALLGYEPAQVSGRRCAEVLGCSYCGPACAAMEAREGERPRVGFPTQLTNSKGRKRSILMDAVPLGGGRVAVLLRDVTDAERVRRALLDKWVFHGLVGVAAATKEIVDRVRDVAPYDSTVLILGESGTGKELVARAIHAESVRADRPFVAVNCSAYSENLLESELFGHARGSFTGADRDRQGRFELAHGGTVFLDEIGEISPKIQVKLLRVLQEREIERVGENRARPVDLRVVAACTARSARGASARISTTASTSSPCGSRPCATAARTSRRSWTTSSRSCAGRRRRRCAVSRRRCSTRSSATRGRATSASSRTWSRARSFARAGR